MRLVALESYKYRSNRRIGLPAPVLTVLFPTSLTVFPPIPAPEPLLVRVHPLLSLTSSSELYSFVTRSEPKGFEHLSWGFAPLRDTSLWSPLTVSNPTAHLTFRPQCFSHSRRLTPPLTSWAYFIPQPRPGLTLQGFSPLPSRRAFQRAVPSCRYRDSPANR
jgi:hypothetical protein